MMALIVERVKPSLRGELTRWMLEPSSGVFVGRVSAMVRDKLWDRVCREMGDRSGCILIYASNNEQGFIIRCHGETDRVIEDFEGLQLVRRL